MDESEVFAAVGEEGFARLIAAFYRQVPGDNILGPMYPKDDLPAAEQRLRDYLIYRFGGPPRYIEERGHPRLRMRHIPFPVTQGARDRWMLLMDIALKQTALPPDAEQHIRQFFQGISTIMINRTDQGAQQ